jgi:secreted trypsin-like serine protease
MPFVRIDIDGENAPWEVAIKIDGVGVCGGTRIHQSWVLTAAHCFNRASDPRGVQARTNVTSYKTLGAWVDADRVVLHEAYDRKSLANDLALVKLKSQPPGQWIPPAKPDLKLQLCELLEVSGWGYREEGSGDISDKLQRAFSAVC